MLNNTVHIIGAGLAGMAAAVKLIKSGAKVSLYEMAGHAGGRCRSYFEPSIDRYIDNGNHLVLSGNKYLMEYIKDIGAEGRFNVQKEPEFPFIDLHTGSRWAIKPNMGRIPWWLFDSGRRVPETLVSDYLNALKLPFISENKTIAEVFAGTGKAYEYFWKPLAISVLNTEPEKAAAKLMWPVIWEIFGLGGRAALPWLPKKGLSDGLVDPAIDILKSSGAEIYFNKPVKKIEFAENKVAKLGFGDDVIEIGEGVAVIMAIPPSVAVSLIPGLKVPNEFRPIVNVHYVLSEELVQQSQLKTPFIGIIGGTAEWLFIKGDVASVTVSAANELVKESIEVIAEKVWRDVARVIGTNAKDIPPYKIIKEKRATIAQTPEILKLRPSIRPTPAPHASGGRIYFEFRNLYFAGDWIDTGLPATIEGAIRSGYKVVEMINA